MPENVYTVAKGVSEYLEPVLESDGFLELRSKGYVRIGRECLQFLFVHVEQKHFVVEYGTMLLCVPHEFFVLTNGGRFPDAIGKHYPARSEKLVRGSMEQVCSVYQAKYRDWFAFTSSAGGLLAADRERRAATAIPEQHHDVFLHGCCQLLEGELDLAKASFESARAMYLAETLPGRAAWARPWAERCSDALDALARGTHGATLDAWKEHTVQHLNLGQAKAIKKRRPS